MVERMSAYHCDKLCSKTCCAALRDAIDFANNSDLDEISRSWKRPKDKIAGLLFDVHDPAKLAQLMAMGLRARGIDAGPINHDGWEIWPYKDKIIVDTTYMEDAMFFFALPEFRALLARVMATPADESSREQCEKLIRGEQ
jgi:hypothetical protein